MNQVRTFVLALLWAPLALAQTAALTGRVTDQTGAVIPGARVTLTPRTGAAISVTSRDDGTYLFASVPQGGYTVTASAPDLAMEKPAAITLHAGSQTLNLQLKIAAAAQQLTIQDNAGPTVSTEAANNASALVLRGDDLQALSDDPDDLQADLQALAGPSAGPNGGSMFVDGFSGGQLPPKESIREIRINQNPFSPEYDKLGYGRIEIFTKPGSQKFHGSIAYNYANDIWNSRNPYAAQKAPLLLNESENSVSGPLNHKASFTLDFEHQAVDNGSIINAVVLDPQSLTPTAFTNILKTPQRRTRVSPRIDYQLNANNTLSARYTFTRTDITNAGVGAFDLISRGYHVQNTYNTLQMTETAVLGASVNETRFQYFRWSKEVTPNSTDPALLVSGAFRGGGAQTGHATDSQNAYELQNYTSIIRGAHSWRFGVRLRFGTEDSVSPQNFGGTFTFASLTSYQITELGMRNGLTPDQIRAMGGGAAQFSLNAGVPGLAVQQFDAAAFIGDDWRLRPNLTLNLGLRYEAQTNIQYHPNLAPRIGFAWAPKGSKKMIVRGGFGMFYDRFALANTLTADRYNGIVQQQYLITNPNFYPLVPPVSALVGSGSPQVIQVTDSNLRAAYIMQSAFTLERQLPKNTTLAVTYTNSHGVHVLRSLDINAPLPGSGLYPDHTPSPVFQQSSNGIYNQNQVIANVNSRVNQQVSLFGFYVWNKAKSDSDGLSTFPANPYNYQGEYGPAATDIRHRILVGGSLNTKWNLRFSPYVTAQSGPPFNITTGTDPFATTLYNARPGVTTDPTRPGVVQTPYGLLDPNPLPGEPILSRNYGRCPGMIMVNLRVVKTIGFGPERGGGSASSGGPSGPPPNLAGPGGMRGLFSPPSTGHRYNLSIGVSARNLLNHNNPGPIIGSLASPLFGRANQIFGTPNGEGFSENANNRRMELQIRLTF